MGGLGGHVASKTVTFKREREAGFSIPNEWFVISHHSHSIPFLSLNDVVGPINFMFKRGVSLQDSGVILEVKPIKS